MEFRGVPTPYAPATDGTVVVSNHPKCAAAIERAHSDGNGLLAYNGSSYGNLFSGDAERSALTMSGAGRRKEGRTGAGYFGYFVRPGQATRTMVASFVEIGRERVAATRQRRRGVEPRVERGWVYALLRTFTTIITRDVSVQGVMNDMCEGRATIYVDMLGYDVAQGLQLVPMQVTRNSNGYPIINANGKEYSQCR